MINTTIAESELILHLDGSIYHLNLMPEDIADTVIVVGDPQRVPLVSRYFDRIDTKKHYRELITHTGFIGKKHLSVISTGMSTGNIDIVMNELDAIANIDLNTRQIKLKHRRLHIVRFGTSGSLQKEIAPDSLIVSAYALGFDNLLAYYERPVNAERDSLEQKALEHFKNYLSVPYAATGSPLLYQHLLSKDAVGGITATATGFYGPQGRKLRAQLRFPYLLERLRDFDFNGLTIANFEMETSAIYGLGEILGHDCCSLNVIVANRCSGHFTADSVKAVDKMIKYGLEKLATI